MADNIKTVNINSDYVGDDAYFGNDLPTIDIRKGGQWGALPRIGGVDSEKPIHEWMHEQSYLRRDVIPILLQAPKGFDLLPNSEHWKAAVKALFEVHAKTIEGLNASLTVEHNEKQLGLSGASMREPNDVKREATSVTLGGIGERYGLPFEILLDVWIRFLIMDPDLKIPLIAKVADQDNLPEAWSADWYSCTVLFIEPDPLYKKAVHVWLVSNLYPSANPDIIGKKDKTAARENKELSIDMGGFALPPTNKRVKALGNAVLSNIQLWAKDPDDILLPADSVDTSIEALDGQAIYYDGVKGESSGTAGTAGSQTGGATETP